MSISELAAPVCADQARRLKLCVLAEYHHQSAIKQWTWIRGTLEKADYRNLQKFAQTARDIVKDARRAVKDPQRAVEDAQEALDQHTAEQGY